MIKNGFALFADALALAVRALPDVVRGGLLILLLTIASDIWSADQLANGGRLQVVSALLSFVMGILTVGVIAVNLHRFAILGEASKIVPFSNHVWSRLAYILEWFVLCILIGFVVFMMIIVFWVIAQRYGLETASEGDFLTFIALGRVAMQQSYLLTFCSNWLICALFLILLFNFGIGLAAIAIGQPRRDLRQVLMHTRPYRGENILLAGLVALLLALFWLAVTILVGSASPQVGSGNAVGLVVARTAQTFSMIFVLPFIAACVTTIYQRVEQ